MSKLRIFPSILGRIFKPGKSISKPKVFFFERTSVSFPAIQILNDAKTDWSFKTSATVFSVGLVSLASDVQEEDSEDDESAQLPNNLSIDSSDNNENDNRDDSYLVDEEGLKNVKVAIIEGDKPGSNWLVVDDIYICHRYQGSEAETFWECSGRRKYNCSFKLGTFLDENGSIRISYMYKLECHDCEQTKLGPIMQKFRNALKQRMKENYKAKFHNIFNDEKKQLINKYNDNPGLLERIIYELKDKRSYRVAAQRAKQKCFPKNPQTHADMDLKKIGLDKFELGRTSHFDPNVKDKDIILLGTPLTAEAWAKSEFKSGDGTFKICPKQFYQVFVLMALYGGVYLPCLIGLLPDKTNDTYGRFFAMVWTYLNNNGLQNDFTGHFFMTDFERNIRDNFHLFWPNAKLLGCYFHFSQLIWKRVKKGHHQVSYEKDDDFNALVRRISALPFTKPETLDEAFAKFRARADKLEDSKLKEFSHDLIGYAQLQWRDRFAVQDWNLYDINCLMVPSTNNGNEGANGRFLVDFGVHPPFWSFCLDACEEVQRVNDDIPSILYGSLVPKETPLYHSLKEQREVAKANYEAGLIDLDGYLGKVGSISLSTGKSKFSADDEEDDNIVPKRKNVVIDDEPEPAKKKRKIRAAIPGRRGRPATNTGKGSRTASVGEQVSAGLPSDARVSDEAQSEPTVTANPTSSLPNLPWPDQQGLQSIPSALPATSSRTTSSAVPTVITAQISSTPIMLSSIEVFNNSLLEHIQKYNLGLRERASIPGDGNCWYSSNVDLVKHHKLKAPEDPNELRLAVTNTLKSHPQKSQWIRSLFHGKSRSFNRFVKEHSVPGTFVDNFGLLVLATSEYLNVTYHIVGTSNNEKDPVTVIGNKDGDSNVVFHLGYYQDDTDQGGHQAGHYQSLEPVPGKAVPCCKIASTTSTSNREEETENQSREEANVELLKSEEKILKSFPNDKNMVKLSLKRLVGLKCVSLDDLCCSNILSILYNDIRPNFTAKTAEGKTCRRLLKMYQNLCRKDPEFDEEDLPAITDVSDDESSIVKSKKKSYKSLFAKETRRASNIISQMGTATSIRDAENIAEASARASSTVIETEPTGNEEEVAVEETTMEHIEPARRKSRRKRKTPPKSTVFGTDSVVLTPPPPCSPATPPRRGRGRPRIYLDETSPVQAPKRGRGRPKKNT